jgi:hypothetical protein
MLAGSLRAAHEPRFRPFISLILRREKQLITESAFTKLVGEQLAELNLALNVSQINGFIVSTLISLYPSAKYILTLRDGGSWVRSVINHHQHHPVSRSSLLHKFAVLRFGSHSHSPYDRVLKKYGLFSLEGYLSYWKTHNSRVINSVPASHLLIVPTKAITREIPTIAGFIGISQESISHRRSFEFAGEYNNCVFDRINADYIIDRIDWYTATLLSDIDSTLGSWSPEQIYLLSESLRVRRHN